MIPVAWASPVSTLARLLFPSWALFDIPSSPPTLEIRRAPSAGDFAEWRPAFVAPGRRWWHLVFNPGGTQVLWYQTQVERFYLQRVNDVNADADQRASAITVRAIAEACVPAQRPRDGAPCWQYRIVVRPPHEPSPLVAYESALFA